MDINPASINKLKNNHFSALNILKSWEFLLFILLAIVLLMDFFLSPQLFTINNLLAATNAFMERSIIAIPLALIIITGYIDISVSSIAALTGVTLGVLWQAGIPLWLSILIGIVVGTLGGFINGIVAAKLKIPSLVVTLSTLILYRGICYILLGDNAVRDLPKSFGYFGGAYKLLVIPNSLIIFVILAIIFGLILHFTTFGRSIYAIGNNENAARYSGIPVDKIRIILYTITGFISAIAGVLVTSRINSARPDIAEGAEMAVITIVLLGGVMITGGKGSIPGVVLSAFLIGFIQYTLRLINIQEVVISIVTGGLLIFALLIPRFNEVINDIRRRSDFMKSN